MLLEKKIQNQVGDNVLEKLFKYYSSIVVFSKPVLLKELNVFGRLMCILKYALKPGSSKHGNTFLASMRCSWVATIHLWVEEWSFSFEKLNEKLPSV